MAAGVPAGTTLTCPRCKALRPFVNVNGGTTYRCGGCEWRFTLSAVTPTGTSNGAITAGSSVAISVASGGTSFTSGMKLLYDTGTSAEVVTVGAGATGTSIPVPGGFAKSHNTAATFGQLSITPTDTASDAVPAAPGYGF